MKEALSPCYLSSLFPEELPGTQAGKPPRHSESTRPQSRVLSQPDLVLWAALARASFSPAGFTGLGNSSVSTESAKG